MYLFTREGEHVFLGSNAEVGGHLVGDGFFQSNPWDQAPAVKFGGSCPYLLSHLISTVMIDLICIYLGINKP